MSDGWARNWAIVDNSISLRYNINKALAGVADGSSLNRLKVNDRHLALERHQWAWQNLAWESDECTPMIHGVSALSSMTYDFELVWDSNQGQWKLFGNVLSQAKPGLNRLRFTQLPSVIRAINKQDWSVVIEDQICNYTMDPSQDLLVLIYQTRVMQ